MKHIVQIDAAVRTNLSGPEIEQAIRARCPDLNFRHLHAHVSISPAAEDSGPTPGPGGDTGEIRG